MQRQTADSVKGWLKLARASRKLAASAVVDAETRNLAWSHAGFACECVFKAAIMAHERLNTWPTSSERRELHTHDLRKLARILDLEIGPDDEVAASWSVVLQWRREHMYVADEMPRPVIEALLDAAFNENGVIEWISRRYLRGHLPLVGIISSS